VALETWGNDNVSFPAEIFRAWVGDLYREDQLYRGELRVAGRPARLEDIRCPTMVVTFEQDHIVPKASATAILDRLDPSLAQHVHLSGGHVGAMTSRSAAAGLWTMIGGFFGQSLTRETAAAALSCAG
jgi:polyhydroxyalkanoate synthase